MATREPKPGFACRARPGMGRAVNHSSEIGSQEGAKEFEKILSPSCWLVFSLLPMKLRVDHEADTLYLGLDDSKIVESEEVAQGVVLDYDEHNQVVGIEMLNFSKRISQNLKQEF
jgi:uncharacterized protein YuzE